MFALRNVRDFLSQQKGINPGLVNEINSRALGFAERGIIMAGALEAIFAGTDSEADFLQYLESSDAEDVFLAVFRTGYG